MDRLSPSKGANVLDRSGEKTSGTGTQRPRVREAEDVRELRLGVIALDPLRAIGLEAILSESLPCSIVRLAEGLEEVGGVAAMVLDASADAPGLWPLVRHIHACVPGVPLIVLGKALPSREISRLYEAGARGFLSQSAAESEIRQCVPSVLSGGTWPVLASDEQDEVVTGGETFQPASQTLRMRFTPRELQVLDLLLKGRSNRDIAMTMRIDEATVKAHLGRMLRKSRCSNRVELTLQALHEDQNGKP